jgi:predicted AAA+ superfamily ATPase
MIDQNSNLPRLAAPILTELLKKKGLVILVYGPRQAGKTTLIQSILSENKQKSLVLSGDDLYHQELLDRPELARLKGVVGDAEVLVIDEAQRIENIGLTLKLLIDNLSITIIASGSASFDLANKVNEPLTGRATTVWLYPCVYQELTERYRTTNPATALEEMLRFGMYPKVHTLSGAAEKEQYLYDYINGYLYKDILAFENIRKPRKVLDILTLLALQLGKEVSLTEIAKSTSLNYHSVVSYLDSLEKMFIILPLFGFSRNLRKEVSKSAKYYFVDIGVRNALIRNFNSLSLRPDVGELFENWFVIERYKRAAMERKPANFYFWRTYNQQEIDLVEERGGKLTAWECKWSNTKHPGAPIDWQTAYPQAEYRVINRENIFQNLV